MGYEAREKLSATIRAARDGSVKHDPHRGFRFQGRDHFGDAGEMVGPPPYRPHRSTIAGMSSCPPENTRHVAFPLARNTRRVHIQGVNETRGTQPMRSEISLTDEEIEARFEELGIGLTIDDVIWTRDTLDDFRAARKEWAEAGRIEVDEDGVLVISRAQAAKGQPRRTVYVVDFGPVRGACL
jgi:hypothetical protein